MPLTRPNTSGTHGPGLVLAGFGDIDGDIDPLCCDRHGDRDAGQQFVHEVAGSATSRAYGR
jgi:hypothetical protein